MNRKGVLELACLAVALAVWSYVGWDSALWDARFQLGLHLAAGAAIAGLVVLALRGQALPRTSMDLAILALVTAFGVASLSAWNPGLSARALAAIVATTAMLPVALLALRHRPGWTGLVVSLPIIGLSAGALVVLLWRRGEWILAGGPGLPPLRLAHEGTPFGSVAVPPFVILAALPVALCVPDRRLRRALVAGLVVVGIPLALLSGSRSAWLALAVAAIVLAIPLLGRIRALVTGGPRGIALVAGAGAVAAAVLAIVGGRLLEASSLLYRTYLWRDTLAAWRPDWLLGLGPGAMPYAREAAAPPLSFPVAQPHSHDIPLGILGDAGILGLVVAILLVGWFVTVAGPWRLKTLPGRAAFAILAGFAVGMLFEDLTFLPNFNLLAILLVAICLADAGAVRWEPIRPGRLAWAAAGIAFLSLGLVMSLGDAAAIAYRMGIDSAAAGDWESANGSLEASVRLDPWHPMSAKTLAITADETGRSALARSSARRATRLNPGDSASWINLALLCLDAGDTTCAAEAADGGTASAPGALELVNAAIVNERLGRTSQADEAYRLSLLTNWWTGLTVPWPRSVAIDGAGVTELGGEVAEMNALIARRVQGEDLAVSSYRYPLPRALALAMTGDRSGSQAALAAAVAAEPASPTVWEIAALLERHWGQDDALALRMAKASNGLSATAAPPTGGVHLTADIASFRQFPGDGLVRGATRLTPVLSWPWVLDPLLAR